MMTDTPEALEEIAMLKAAMSVLAQKNEALQAQKDALMEEIDLRQKGVGVTTKVVEAFGIPYEVTHRVTETEVIIEIRDRITQRSAPLVDSILTTLSAFKTERALRDGLYVWGAINANEVSKVSHNLRLIEFGYDVAVWSQVFLGLDVRQALLVFGHQDKDFVTFKLPTCA
jgi:hypothetical protein